ncbi:hypothetical protein SynMVIR181_02859 [Synechococcus sp. MVIR-18-1]|nr:hypothetical protein SynMVIR181_02859 [Synechococcus sp. MVIR-18-1]
MRSVNDSHGYAEALEALSGDPLCRICRRRSPPRYRMG